MNRIRLIVLLFACLACPYTLRAEVEEKNVEDLVLAYFNAFQKQDWPNLIGMLHPKSLEELRNAILAHMPKTTKEIEDGDRDNIEQLLSNLSVKSPEEAWLLRPEVVYLRMLQHSSKTPAMIAMKEVVTEIKEVKIEEAAGDFYADVEVESKLNGKIFSGTTYFIVEPFEGTLKVVAMTKEKHSTKETKKAEMATPRKPSD